jgi:hypothetical protein
MTKTPAGDWTWHEDKFADLQYIFNSNNKILREVNYMERKKSACKEHWEAHRVVDWSKNVKFNLIQPHHVGGDEDVVSPDIAPPPHDDTQAKLEVIREYFTADDGMFRGIMDTSKYTVDVEVKFTHITAVDTRNERFGGTVTIDLTWKVTKMDLVEFIAAPIKWQPGFVPPAFEVQNCAAGDGSADIEAKASPIALINKPGHGYCATQTVTYSGDFWELFELENYPFDIQPLAVILGHTNAMTDAVNFVVTSADLPTIRDTEWAELSSAASCTFELNKGSGADGTNRYKLGHYTLTAEADTARYYSVHLYRVVGVMALFSFASIIALIDSEDMNPGSRLGIVFTLMLNATAYNHVVANKLPTLGYLTFLDKYILVTFGFIAIIGSEVAGIEWISNSHTNNTEEDVAAFMVTASYIDLALWFTIHLCLFLYVKFKVIPFEWAKVVSKKQRFKRHGALPSRAARPP